MNSTISTKRFLKRRLKNERFLCLLPRENFVCNLSGGKLIISAAVAGGSTLNTVVMATLTGVGLLLKTVASLKKYDKKTEQANVARIEYQKILDEIRFYLRGEAFDEKIFLDRLKMIDNFVTDHCMEIPPSISKKYEKNSLRCRFSSNYIRLQNDCNFANYLLFGYF